ncbi:hypothetical protein PP740_gp035 [Stenotrophomonas phage Philippe]|uniref:Uncharacterized protein n=1 Tax=Stenotrophomonas phage Philippe TaxID=2859655 RepID=A0AAE7WN14_9CAUD|nr:hypothetical protein PP740_gp035 [Stenotrophomonas phage Philippe]QYW02234.1 hypothetical protein CPT_Philippe_035 [Stenotrophomonas phage Philippe]
MAMKRSDRWDQTPNHSKKLLLDQLISVFSEALKHLASDKLEDNKEICICYAINKTNLPAAWMIYAKEVINRGLGKYAYFTGWMAGNAGKPPSYAYLIGYSRSQAARRAWLKQLIRDYKAELRRVEKEIQKSDEIIRMA